jgi:DNA-binding transcriptional MerR regulator
MDKELTKLYYTIGEVAAMFDVAPSLLRYWQTEFPGLKPGTNRKGDRRYTKKDIEYIGRIYELVKGKGYTLEGARNALSKGKSSGKGGMDTEVRERLLRVKSDLEQLMRDLE